MLFGCSDRFKTVCPLAANLILQITWANTENYFQLLFKSDLITLLSEFMVQTRKWEAVGKRSAAEEVVSICIVLFFLMCNRCWLEGRLHAAHTRFWRTCVLLPPASLQRILKWLWEQTMLALFFEHKNEDALFSLVKTSLVLRTIEFFLDGMSIWCQCRTEGGLVREILGIIPALSRS